ncbi:MAG: complement resistance protein TraT [Deltaproteobacteria bacterium]|nr:complement resistance protein TraT [Deltaproteobacteria bacterium]
MLEILFLSWFWKKLAAMARDKNRAGSWGALGALGWIGGEVSGAVIALNSRAQGGAIYGYMLGFAALGALVAFAIVTMLSPLPPPGFPVARVIE